MKDKYEDNCIQTCRHLSALTGVDCCVIRIDRDSETGDAGDDHVNECTGTFPAFGDKCTCKKCDRSAILAYGIKEAARWQGRYVFYCPVGLTFIAATLKNGGMIAGPMIMGYPTDALHNFPCPDMIKDVLELPMLSPAWAKSSILRK